MRFVNIVSSLLSLFGLGSSQVICPEVVELTPTSYVDSNYVRSNNLLGEYSFYTNSTSTRITSQNILRVAEDEHLRNFTYEITFNKSDLLIIDNDYAFVSHELFRSDNNFYFGGLFLNGVDIIADFDNQGSYCYARFNRSQLIEGDNIIRLSLTGYADNYDNYIGFGIYDSHNLGVYQYASSQYNYFEPYFEPIRIYGDNFSEGYDLGYLEGKSDGYDLGYTEGLSDAPKNLFQQINFVNSLYTDDIIFSDLVQHGYINDIYFDLYSLALLNNNNYSRNVVSVDFNYNKVSLNDIMFNFRTGFTGTIQIFDEDGNSYSYVLDGASKFYLFDDYSDSLEVFTSSYIDFIDFSFTTPDGSSMIYTDNTYFTGYNVGYSEGKTNGYNAFQVDLNNKFNEGYSEGKSDGYDQGYEVGYNKGYFDDKPDDKSLYYMVLAVVDAPINMMSQMFDFDILGVNISNLVFGLLTVCAVAWVIKFFI